MLAAHLGCEHAPPYFFKPVPDPGTRQRARRNPDSHAYALRGLDPAQALAQAQIAPALLARPDGRITALQMERLSDAAMRELDDEALGWFSRPLPWGSYGMLARASITAPHLGLAMARWCRHHGLLTQDVRLELAVQGDVARLTLHEARDLGALREFCHVSLLRNALGVACWLVDSRIPLLDAAFAFGAPPHADAYAVLFSAPARFRAAPTHISPSGPQRGRPGGPAEPVRPHPAPAVEG